MGEDLIVKVGIDEDYTDVYIDMYNGSLLVEGLIGSGKTTIIRGILNNLLEYYSDVLRVTLIDTKGVEFVDYKGKKGVHVIDDVSVLDVELVKLSEDLRLRRLSIQQAKCKSIEDYNSKNDKKIPYRFVVVDDIHIYTLIKDTKDILDKIVKIMNYGKLFGIYFIVTSVTSKVSTGMNYAIAHNIVLGGNNKGKNSSSYDSDDNLLYGMYTYNNYSKQFKYGEV